MNIRQQTITYVTLTPSEEFFAFDPYDESGKRVLAQSIEIRSSGTVFCKGLRVKKDKTLGETTTVSVDITDLPDEVIHSLARFLANGNKGNQ